MEEIVLEDGCNSYTGPMDFTATRRGHSHVLWAAEKDRRAGGLATMYFWNNVFGPLLRESVSTHAPRCNMAVTHDLTGGQSKIYRPIQASPSQVLPTPLFGTRGMLTAIVFPGFPGSRCPVRGAVP